MLNMFRTLMYPSSGACDYSVELPHWLYCSWFDVCWRFGVGGLEWYPCCRLKSTSCASACNTDTTPTHILMSETCWAYKKWNKIASDIKLVKCPILQWKQILINWIKPFISKHKTKMWVTIGTRAVWCQVSDEAHRQDVALQSRRWMSIEWSLTGTCREEKAASVRQCSSQIPHRLWWMQIKERKNNERCRMCCLWTQWSAFLTERVNIWTTA